MKLWRGQAGVGRPELAAPGVNRWIMAGNDYTGCTILPIAHATPTIAGHGSPEEGFFVQAAEK